MITRPITLAAAIIGGALLLLTAPAVHADKPAVPAKAVDVERPGSYTRFVITLPKALPEGRDLTLHLGQQGGSFRQAWATVPGVLQARGDVDAADLRFDNNRITGEVRAGIQMPGEEQFHDATYQLDLTIAGDRITGSYEGWYGLRGRHMVIDTDELEVTADDLSHYTYGQTYRGRLEGNVEHRAVESDLYELELNLGSVLVGGPADRFRRVGVRLRMRDGKLRMGDVYGTDFHEDSWQGEIFAVNLQREGQRLRGSITLDIETPRQDRGTDHFPDNTIPAGWRGPVLGGRYTIHIDGTVTGNTIAGQLRSRYEDLDVPVPSPHFSGSLRDNSQRPINPGNGVYELMLRQAVEQRDDLRVQLDRRDNRFVAAAAIGRTGGHSRINTDNLTLEGNRLRGSMIVHFTPESAYLPGDVSLDVTYELDLWLDRGWRGSSYRVAGWYTCTFGERHDVSGKANGLAQNEAGLRREHAVRADLGWPAWHGPEGTFAAQKAGHELVESLDEARLVWRTEITPPARGQITRYHQRNIGRLLDRGGPTGGGGSVIVADGKVYFFYFQPTGDAALESYIQHETALGRRVAPEQWRIQADDIVLCVDAATGQTLWKTTYRKGGIYWAPGKDTFTATPTVADGRIFALGTSGWIYALDAKTGERLWEQPLPWAHGAARQLQDALENNRMAQGNQVHGGARVVVDNLLITPDYRGGIIAFDVKTGEQRWHARNSGTSAATPVVWRHEGKAYIVSPAPNGHVVCVRTDTGEEAWRISDAQTTGYDLAVANNTLVLQRGSGDQTRLAAYRIRPDGYDQAWSLSPELGGIDGRPVSIRENVVYAQLNSALTLIDLTTGEVLADDGRRRGSASTIVWAEGRLFMDLDATHSRTWQRMYDADPNSFGIMHGLWSPPHQQTSSYYRRVLAHPIVDGRIFLRGAHGIYCYDLRIDP